MAPVDDHGFAARMALARAEDPADVALRRIVVWRVVAISLAWLVSLALLLGWELTGGPGPPAVADAGPKPAPGDERYAAALLGVFLPFVAAVVATRHGQWRLGGVYVVLTLVMVPAALFMAGWI